MLRLEWEHNATRKTVNKYDLFLTNFNNYYQTKTHNCSFALKWSKTNHQYNWSLKDTYDHRIIRPLQYFFPIPQAVLVVTPNVPLISIFYSYIQLISSPILSYYSGFMIYPIFLYTGISDKLLKLDKDLLNDLYLYLTSYRVFLRRRLFWFIELISEPNFCL